MLQSRTKVFIILYVAYTAFYMNKKNYVFWMPAVSARLGLTPGQIGVVQTSLESSLGLSKLFAGPLVDCYSQGKVLAISLAVCGICNMLLMYADSLGKLSLLWGLNGAFQAFGWPALTKCFMVAFPDARERGAWYGLLSTSQNIGAALTPIILSPLMNWFGVDAATIAPAAAALAISSLIMQGSESLGSGENSSKPNQSKQKREVPSENHPVSFIHLLRECLGGRQVVWLLGICYLFVTLQRSVLSDWVSAFLTDSKDMALTDTRTYLFMLEMGGFTGSLLSGWLSDNIFRGRREPVIAACALSTIPLFLGLAAVTSPTSLALVYFSLGFATFSPHMLIGLLARELVEPSVRETVGGLVKFIGQLGASAAGSPFGYLVELRGWSVLSTVGAIAGCGSLALSELARRASTTKAKLG